MSSRKVKEILFVALVIAGFLFSVNKLSAATVTIDFENLSPSIRNHGSSISVLGYKLSANVIENIKPTDAVSNHTTSIFTQNTNPLTITKGLSNNEIFELLSVDLDEIFNSGTPIVKISGVKSDNTIVSSQFVAGGSIVKWIPVPNLFTNLISLTFSHNTPFLYHIDNIVLKLADDIKIINDIRLSSVPLPDAALLYATGILVFGFALYRRRNMPKNELYS